MTTQYVRISAGSSNQFTEFDPGSSYAPVFSTGAGTPVDDTDVAALLTIAANAGVYLDVADVQWSNIPAPAPQWPFVEWVAQTLTDDQQTTARENIGAASLSDISGAGSVRYDTAQALTTSQVAQVLANIKAMPTLRPEQYGAVADGATDDSIAFYNCKIAGLAQSAAGFVMQLQQGKDYYLGQAAYTAHGTTSLFDLATGVYVTVPGGSGRGNTAATRIITDHTFTNYAIAPGAGTQGCGISGVLIESDMAHGYSGVCKGVSFLGTEWGHLRDVGIGNYSDVSLSTLGSVDLHLENLSIGHDVSGRVLTDYTPAFLLSGTDHVLINIEANGGNTNSTIGTINAAGHFYNPAIQVYDCSTVKAYGVNGEFADCGWYFGGDVGGTANTFCTLNQFVDCRGDYNAGHGLVLDGAAWNYFGNTTVYNNSNNGNGLFNGVHILNNTQNIGNRFTTVIGGSPGGSANIMGFYFYDALTGGVTQLDMNMVGTIGGQRQGMTFDYAFAAAPYHLSYIKGNGAGSYIFRPPSRHVAGATWCDLFAPTAPVLTFADGGGAVVGAGTSIVGNGGWRTLAGVLTGNLLHPITVECLNGATTGWLTVTSGLVTTGAPVTTPTCAFAPVAWNTVPAIVAKLGNNQIARFTANAAGVTAGYMEALTPALLSSTNAIAASTSYAAAVQVVAAAASSARNVKFIIDCFSGSTFLSSITADAGVNDSTTAVTTHAATFTTPAGCNAIQVRVRITGVALNEVHYVGLISVDNHSTQTIPVYS